MTKHKSLPRLSHFLKALLQAISRQVNSPRNAPPRAFDTKPSCPCWSWRHLVLIPNLGQATAPSARKRNASCLWRVPSLAGAAPIRPSRSIASIRAFRPAKEIGEKAVPSGAARAAVRQAFGGSALAEGFVLRRAAAHPSGTTQCKCAPLNNGKGGPMSFRSQGRGVEEAAGDITASITRGQRERTHLRMKLEGEEEVGFRNGSVSLDHSL